MKLSREQIRNVYKTCLLSVAVFLDAWKRPPHEPHRPLTSVTKQGDITGMAEVPRHMCVQLGDWSRCVACWVPWRANLEELACPARCIGVRQHTMWQLQDLFFCDHCGMFSQIMSRKLRQSCSGPPKAPARLRRMRAGRHPVTGEHMGLPQPVFPELWVCTLEQPLPPEV